MTALRKRAQALENKFAHEAELEFKAGVRSSKMIGRWAGYAMGVDDVEAYARTVVQLQVVEPHRLVERLRQDFCRAGVSVSDDDLGKRMHDFHEQAAQELYSGS